MSEEVKKKSARRALSYQKATRIKPLSRHPGQASEESHVKPDSGSFTTLDYTCTCSVLWIQPHIHFSSIILYVRTVAVIAASGREILWSSEESTFKRIWGKEFCSGMPFPLAFRAGWGQHDLQTFQRWGAMENLGRSALPSQICQTRGLVKPKLCFQIAANWATRFLAIISLKQHQCHGACAVPRASGCSSLRRVWRQDQVPPSSAAPLQ